MIECAWAICRRVQQGSAFGLAIVTIRRSKAREIRYGLNIPYSTFLLKRTNETTSVILRVYQDRKRFRIPPPKISEFVKDGFATQLQSCPDKSRHRVVPMTRGSDGGGKIQVSFELWGIVRSLQRLPHCP